MADRPQSRSRRRVVDEVAEARAHRAADAIAERYRDADPSRLLEHLAGQRRASEPVSEQVRAIIEGCGLTRAELSRRTGVAESVLSRFVRGERSITLDQLDRLDAMLRLRVSSRRRP